MMRSRPSRTRPFRRRATLPCAVALALWFTACGPSQDQTQALFRADAPPNIVDGVEYKSGDWTPHLEAGAAGVSWGNHRAVVEVSDESADSPAVVVQIPWRRRDRIADTQAFFVVDASTNTVVANAYPTKVAAEGAELVFEPHSGSHTYHIYYLPWRSTGGYYPTISYDVDTPQPDPAWRSGLSSLDVVPQARTAAMESVDDFHSFFPMEVAATADEVAQFMANQVDGWAVIPEHRDFPVRMTRNLPYHWTQAPRRSLESTVLRDENFAFQIALVSGSDPLEDVQVTYEGFPPEWEESMTCFNCEGTDLSGGAFKKEVHVPSHRVQAIWIGFRVPRDQTAGMVEGSVVVSSSNRGEKRVPVSVTVLPSLAENHGLDEPDLMTRLAWLNSTTGRSEDFITPPFHPVEVKGDTLSVLGRAVVLGASGLPASIVSFFAPEMTYLLDNPLPILGSPLQLEIVSDGAPERLEVTQEATVERLGRGSVRWSAASQSEHFELQTRGRLEYDGSLDLSLAVIPRSDLSVEDIRLPVVLTEEAAQYMLGLGLPGGLRPASLDWTWAQEKHQEGVWLGGVNRGLQYVLRDRNYVRPLNTNFYQNQPLNMPRSWDNDGRGGIQIRDATTSSGSSVVVATNYSGPRHTVAGDTLYFDARFLITPFKPIDTKTHFETRFVHKYVPVDSVIEWGGTVVNVHHANEINPYINYPFFALSEQSAYIAEAHRKGVKVKLYNTIRELTYKAHELFALRSLGHEVLNDGEGGGHSWMQEHLEADYHSAWHAWRVDDAAMLNKGTSRWTNYYIEGLSWLAENQHIDGLYLDDIAFDRETVKRMVNVLNQHRDEVVIDLHSANQFNPRDGFTNSAMLYMEHFPFVSRLWFGEYFDYDQDEGYWMTEVSGLPFGLMGEMLQDGGHPYRGLLYGMTARMYGDVDPRPVWNMLTEHRVAEGRMLGYWLEDSPVVTGDSRILATTYTLGSQALVVFASWADEDVSVSVEIDEDRLGLVGPISASAPAVDGLQDEGPLDLTSIPIPANRGLFVLLRSQAQGSN